MNYRTCEAINTNFRVNDLGDVLCPVAEVLVNNSLQRAYIFTNLFFYDLTQREIGKLTKKIKDKHETVVQSAGLAPDAVEQIFPNLSAQFQQEVGDNSLDPLIKFELGKIKPHLSLQLSPGEKNKLDQMYSAICEREITKFKKAVIFTQDNKGKPYEVTFSQKYIDNLPPRCQQVLKPTIKMLAYMDGRIFDQFQLGYDHKLTYTWSYKQANFDEEKLKDAIKKLIATPPGTVV